MNQYAKFNHRAATLLLCFCLMAMGNSDVYALCFSQSHPGGSAIHKPCPTPIHGVTHKGSFAKRQDNSQKCDAGQYSCKNRCIDVLLPSPAKNIQTQFFVQLPAIIDSVAFLDPDAMALFFSRQPAAALLFPVPSPPVFLQTQSFLN